MDNEKPNRELQEQIKNLQKKNFKPEIVESIKQKSKYVNKPIVKR